MEIEPRGQPTAIPKLKAGEIITGIETHLPEANLPEDLRYNIVKLNKDGLIVEILDHTNIDYEADKLVSKWVKRLSENDYIKPGQTKLPGFEEN